MCWTPKTERLENVQLNVFHIIIIFSLATSGGQGNAIHCLSICSLIAGFDSSLPRPPGNVWHIAGYPLFDGVFLLLCGCVFLLFCSAVAFFLLSYCILFNSVARVLGYLFPAPRHSATPGPIQFEYTHIILYIDIYVCVRKVKNRSSSS